MESDSLDSLIDEITRTVAEAMPVITGILGAVIGLHITILVMRKIVVPILQRGIAERDGRTPPLENPTSRLNDVSSSTILNGSTIPTTKQLPKWRQWF